MNITGQQPYQKAPIANTVAQGKAHMAKVARLSCIVCGARPVHVHHAKTGGGGRKNDMLVLPLCHRHHTGKDGIHTVSRPIWQLSYGTETELLEKVEEKLHAER